MKKKDKQIKGKEVSAMSRDDILNQVRPLESRLVDVVSWPAPVRMQNVGYAEMMRIISDAGDDKDAREAMIVAAVCSDLELTDAYKLQTGNGAQFLMLLGAVNGFLNYNLSEDLLKN